MKIISLDKYREKVYNRRIKDMERAADDLIQLAYRVGVCPTCGALYGMHLTYCPEKKKT